MSHEYDWLMQLAGDLALRASAVARERFARCDAWRKADRTWATDADNAAQKRITDELAERYPDHAVLAEETLAEASRRVDPAAAEFCWVIDPLDGTRNFVRGVPVFATAIAVLHKGRPVAAAVADAMTGLLYRAVAGGGSFAAGRRLAVRQEPPGPEALVAFPSGRDQPTLPNILAGLARFTLRNLGSSALHLALVAGGALDAAFCLECKLWDLAAGALLVLEAGGRVSDLDGNDRACFDLSHDLQADTPYVAGSAAFVAELLAILRRR